MAKDERLKLLKLPPEVKKRLQENAETIVEAEKSLAILKEMGMDTSVFDAHLEFAKASRKALLDNFS